MMGLKEQLLAIDSFIDNEYLDSYVALIEANRDTKRELFKTQCHHIVPRCYELDNSKTNLVHLLFKDHLIAHYYLALCTKGSLQVKLVDSFYLITHSPYGTLGGELSKTGGYHWAFYEEGKDYSSYIRGERVVWNERKIYCAELDTTYFSGIEASKATGVTNTQISVCCLGGQTKVGGYHWCFDDDEEAKSKILSYIGKPRGFIKERSVLCIETNEIFSSIKEAAAAKNIRDVGGICSCCKNKQKSAGGFHWCYTKEGGVL